MALKPWYRVATPREDLRRREPLDAAQFAVHLDKVVAGTAPREYVEAERFFERTYPTEGLVRIAAEVVRRLSGERQGANAVLNLTTNFGGGKTHALTLLYHLARLGPKARSLPGVPEILEAARVSEVPVAAVATFVGTDWSVAGRADGGTTRLTPWGDLAWQLAQQTGRPELFEAAAADDRARVRPGGEVIRRFLPDDRPVLILMDEVMSFMTAARTVAVGGSTLASQFYSFVDALAREAESRDRVVLVVSLPKSEQEMAPEDWQDFTRLRDVTGRIGEALVLAKDLEIAEIVRRRLFDDVGARADIDAASRAFARLVQEQRQQLAPWLPFDRAEEVFRATYPFHPTLLSVFERKWQALPLFQRTRGILRLLAQWVADAYAEDHREARPDPLIALGTAPLDDEFFRTAVLDQLGEQGLQAAIISDIAGEGANADRLDEAARDTVVGSSRVHRKVATTIFFESSGGQVREIATLPEVRLAVGEPELEIGHIENAIDALRDACYFLEEPQDRRYRFSTRPNLNKLVADRRAALDATEVEDAVRAAVHGVFRATRGTEAPFEIAPFPDEPSAVPDVPALQLVVLAPARGRSERTKELVERCLREHGASVRLYKNALVFAVPDADGAAGLISAGKQYLAWRSLEDEAPAREFDAQQMEQLRRGSERAKRDFDEAVWRAYRYLLFLGRDGDVREEDLGVPHSSAAQSMQALIQMRLKQRDEVTSSLAPARLVQNWPATTEWSTKRVRDAVYGSPTFTRLLVPQALKETIARGVGEGLFGYAAKRDSNYIRLIFSEPLEPAAIEFSDDIVLLPEALARQLAGARPSPEAPVPAAQAASTAFPTPDPRRTRTAEQPSIFQPKLAALRWRGEIPPHRWTQFYAKVLTRLVPDGGLTIRVSVESRPDTGLFSGKVEETKLALRELGLAEDVAVEARGGEEATDGRT